MGTNLLAVILSSGSPLDEWENACSNAQNYDIESCLRDSLALDRVAESISTLLPSKPLPNDSFSSLEIQQMYRPGMFCRTFEGVRHGGKGAFDATSLKGVDCGEREIQATLKMIVKVKKLVTRFVKNRYLNAEFGVGVEEMQERLSRSLDSVLSDDCGGMA